MRHFKTIVRERERERESERGGMRKDIVSIYENREEEKTEVRLVGVNTICFKQHPSSDTQEITLKLCF